MIDPTLFILPLVIATACCRLPLFTLFPLDSRTLLIWVSLLSTSISAASFYDPIVTDRSTTLDYLDRVAAEVGYERLAAVPYSYALYLSMRLGQIDRLTVKPEALLEHIEHAVRSRHRFYPQMKESDFRQYVLPLRIRYEPLQRARWRSVLAEQLSPLLSTTSSPQEAAQVVLNWVRQSIQLWPTHRSYLLRERGDMDPLSTLRGGYADPIDLTLFAIASLRAVGLQARMVWAPNLTGLTGGKVWLEWRCASDDWHPWCVDGPAKLVNHRTWLRNDLATHWNVVLTHPEDPYPISGEYADTATYHATQSSSLGSNTGVIEGSVMVLNDHRLKPVMGRELGHRNIIRDTADIGAGTWWITRGQRPGRVGILPLKTLPGANLWYQIDLDSGKQWGVQSPQAPDFFRSAAGVDVDLDPRTPAVDVREVAVGVQTAH